MKQKRGTGPIFYCIFKNTINHVQAITMAVVEKNERLENEKWHKCFTSYD
jgi:hypothetical protein